MKTCPFCAEEIQDAAIVCRYCRRPMPGYENEVPEVSSTLRDTQTKTNRLPVVFGGVGLFAVALFAVAFFFSQQKAGLFVQILPTATNTPVPTAETCFVQAVDFLSETSDILTEWMDADKIAGSTARMNLGPAIAVLQEVRRKADKLEPPSCARNVKIHLVASMDYAIEGYLAFLSEKSDYTVNSKFENAAAEFSKVTTAIDLVKGTGRPTAFPKP